MNISIIIPCYNEEEVLSLVLVQRELEFSMF